MAYCEPDDLLKGDIPFPERYGDGSDMIDFAADTIDGYIGHLYETPVHVPIPPQENRPTLLCLKNVNVLLASGRMILDMAAGGEDDNLHAYGASLVAQGMHILEEIASGNLILKGAEKLEGITTGPIIANEDPESLVEGFYQQVSHGEIRWLDPLAPYEPR